MSTRSWTIIKQSSNYRETWDGYICIESRGINLEYMKQIMKNTYDNFEEKEIFSKFSREIISSNKLIYVDFSLFSSSFFLSHVCTAVWEQTKRSNSWNRSALTNALLLHSHRASHKFKVLTSLATFPFRVALMQGRKPQIRLSRMASIVSALSCRADCRRHYQCTGGPLMSELVAWFIRARKIISMSATKVGISVLYAPSVHFFAAQRDEKDYPFVMQWLYKAFIYRFSL